MVKSASTIALKADPSDPEDFDVTEAALDRALTERRTRGPNKAPTKAQVTLRLDPDVLERFKATGRGWQSRMNQALRSAAGL